MKALSKKDGNMLPIFERRILGMIYSPIDDQCIWIISYNNEIHKLWNELDIVNFIKIRRLWYLVQLF